MNEHAQLVDAPILLDETPDEPAIIPQRVPNLTRAEYAAAVLRLADHGIKHQGSTTAERITSLLSSVFQSRSELDLSATCQFLDDENYRSMIQVLDGCRHYGSSCPLGTRETLDRLWEVDQPTPQP